MKTLKIRQERMHRNWSIEYVAESIGVTTSTIQKIETNIRKPSYEVLVKLENLFNLNHRELFAVVNDDTNL